MRITKDGTKNPYDSDFAPKPLMRRREKSAGHSWNKNGTRAASFPYSSLERAEPASFRDEALALSGVISSSPQEKPSPSTDHPWRGDPDSSTPFLLIYPLHVEPGFPARTVKITTNTHTYRETKPTTPNSASAKNVRPRRWLCT